MIDNEGDFAKVRKSLGNGIDTVFALAALTRIEAAFKAAQAEQHAAIMDAHDTIADLRRQYDEVARKFNEIEHRHDEIEDKLAADPLITADLRTRRALIQVSEVPFAFIGEREEIAICKLLGVTHEQFGVLRTALRW